MKDYKKALGETVRKARKEKRLTQAQLAELIQADTRTILNIENNKGNPKLEILFPLVRILEINPYDVFYPNEVKNSTAYEALRILLQGCTEDQIQKILPILREIFKVFTSSGTIDIE